MLPLRFLLPLLLLFFFFDLWRQGLSTQPWLSNRISWPRTHSDLLACASSVVGLRVCATMPCFSFLNGSLYRIYFFVSISITETSWVFIKNLSINIDYKGVIIAVIKTTEAGLLHKLLQTSIYIQFHICGVPTALLVTSSHPYQGTIPHYSGCVLYRYR